ncbi:MAG: asparagine synthase (glutamine-hydrolyzing) [Terriglobales bacterium]
MCGIAGILHVDGRPASAALVRAMVSSIAHRGPDEQGVHTSGALGLGHSRLSIIDLVDGAQPMCADAGNLWISFNGEIYNYLELREQLTAKGYRFATRSDTEVILRMYEEYGEDCVRHFNGQWAFAIWDNRKRQLFLSRDRVGVRPLFYISNPRQFAFASEVKALFQLPGVVRELDLEALAQIFTFWCTLPPRTVFQGVSELPPGCSLVVEENGQTRQWRYWQLVFEPATNGWSEQRWTEELLQLLTAATRIRLRADVPVGAYLSGGLDSSVVSAIASRLVSFPLPTFSIGFEEREFDESSYQDEVVRTICSEHHRVHCMRGDVAAALPKVIWHTEKPILRTAPAPLLLLAERVRAAGLKVVLTGEGSDEMLGGYDIFKEAKLRRFCARRPDSRLRASLLRRLYPYMPRIQAQPGAYLRAFFHANGDMDDPLFSHLPRWELTSRTQIFLSDEVKQSIALYDPYEELRSSLPNEFHRWDGFSQAQYLEAMILLPGYILSSQGDRVAMAHSVEVRHPFLDHRLVEFAAVMPPSLKMKVLDEKYLLKRCASGLVPPAVVRRPKQPYRAPDGCSILSDPVPEYVREMLHEDTITDYGVFNPISVKKLCQKFQTARGFGAKDDMALVGILSTQLLIRQFTRLPRYEQELPAS